MELTLYSFNKKNNSTKRPNKTDGTTIQNVSLKGSTSRFAPTFLLQQIITDVNYVQWDDYYYFVQDIVFVHNGLWELICVEDVLATWRTQIGNYNGYITRSAVGEANKLWTDTVYPTSDTIRRKTFPVNSVRTGNNFNNEFVSNYAQGSYIIGIIGDNSGTTNFGGVVYYALTPTQFKEFNNQMYGSASGTNFNFAEVAADITDATARLIFNPFQYITSCFWLPFDITNKAITENTTQINTGWWNIPVSASILKQQFLMFNGTVEIAQLAHPQAETRGEWLNLSPYNQYQLQLGPFGLIPIDGRNLLDSTYLFIQIRVDLTTGKAVMELANNTQTFYSQYQEFAISIPIGQATSDFIGGLDTATNAVVNGVSGAIKGGAKIGAGASGVSGADILASGVGDVLTSLTGAANGLKDAAQQIAPDVQTKGTPGSIVGFVNNWMINVKSYLIADVDNERYGHPYMQQDYIYNHPGFNMVANANLEIWGNGNEQQAIKTYLEGGFYYE